MLTLVNMCCQSQEPDVKSLKCTFSYLLQLWSAKAMYFAAGQYYCNGSCYPITCQALEVLKTSHAPEILLSTEAKSVLSSSLTLVSAYATPVAFNLLPCPSTGMPQ